MVSIIDWRLNDSGTPLVERRLINEVKLTIMDVGFKHFLQHPTGHSSATNFLAIFDFAQYAQDKAVFGWYAWGIPINESQDVWMWTPHEYINWKRNYLKPPIPTPAIRVWLYEGVEAHADVNYFYPASVGAQLVTPSPPSP